MFVPHNFLLIVLCINVVSDPTRTRIRSTSTRKNNTHQQRWRHSSNSTIKWWQCPTTNCSGKDEGKGGNRKDYHGLNDTVITQGRKQPASANKSLWSSKKYNDTSSALIPSHTFVACASNSSKNNSIMFWKTQNWIYLVASEYRFLLRLRLGLLLFLYNKNIFVVRKKWDIRLFENFVICIQ